MGRRMPAVNAACRRRREGQVAGRRVDWLARSWWSRLRVRRRKSRASPKAPTTAIASRNARADLGPSSAVACGFREGGSPEVKTCLDPCGRQAPVNGACSCTRATPGPPAPGRWQGRRSRTAPQRRPVPGQWRWQRRKPCRSCRSWRRRRPAMGGVSGRGGCSFNRASRTLRRERRAAVDVTTTLSTPAPHPTHHCLAEGHRQRRARIQRVLADSLGQGLRSREEGAAGGC